MQVEQSRASGHSLDLRRRGFRALEKFPGVKLLIAARRISRMAILLSWVASEMEKFSPADAAGFHEFIAMIRAQAAKKGFGTMDLVGNASFPSTHILLSLS